MSACNCDGFPLPSRLSILATAADVKDMEVRTHGIVHISSCNLCPWISDWHVHMQYIETDLQQLQLRQRHEPRHLCEAIEEQYAQQAAQRPPRRPLHLDSTARPASDSAAAAGATEPTNLSRFKRRWAPVSVVGM